jgi:hypothetical protein
MLARRDACMVGALGPRPWPRRTTMFRIADSTSSRDPCGMILPLVFKEQTASIRIQREQSARTGTLQSVQSNQQSRGRRQPLLSAAGLRTTG